VLPTTNTPTTTSPTTSTPTQPTISIPSTLAPTTATPTPSATTAVTGLFLRDSAKNLTLFQLFQNDHGGFGQCWHLSSVGTVVQSCALVAHINITLNNGVAQRENFEPYCLAGDAKGVCHAVPALAQVGTMNVTARRVIGFSDTLENYFVRFVVVSNAYLTVTLTAKNPMAAATTVSTALLPTALPTTTVHAEALTFVWLWSDLIKRRTGKS
jgi:hypothetical protein